MEYLAVAARGCCRMAGWCVREGKVWRTVGRIAWAVKKRTGYFLDFFFLSLLERGASMLVCLARQLVTKISSVRESPLPEELLSPLVPSREWQTKRQRQKRKNPKPKMSELSTVETTPRLTTEEDDDSYALCRELLLGILDQSEHYFPLLGDTSFTTVEKRKKPKKDLNLTPVAPKRKKQKAKKPQETAVFAPAAAPTISAKAVFWHSAVDASPISSSVFPPLNVPPSLTIHSRIIDFQEQVSTTLEATAQSRFFLTEKVKGIARKFLQGAKAEVFGSYATQLALPSSDLDVVIVHGKIRSREAAQAAVQSLSKLLLSQPFTLHLSPILHAPIPLVRAVIDTRYFPPSQSPLQVDISFNRKSQSVQSHLGLISATYIRELIAVTPGLRCIVLALKQLLWSHGLNCAYTGGVCSYALFVWVAAYIAANPSPACDFGELLTGFCRFFGANFNPQMTGIAVSGFYARTDHCAAVETVDPVCPGSNLTKTAFRIPEVLALLNTAAETLERGGEEWQSLFNLGL